MILNLKKKLEKIKKKIINKEEKKEQAIKNLSNIEKKAKEFWKKTFRKDVEYAKELKSIAESIKENTKLNFYLDYSTFYDKNTYGFIRFGIGGDEIKLELINDKTISIRVNALDPKYRHHNTFRVGDIKRCKKVFLEEILHLYNNNT